MNENNTASSFARRFKKISIVLVCLLPLGVLGTKFGLFPYTAGFLLLSLSVLGSIVVLLINLIWNFRKPGPANRKIILFTSILAIFPLAIAAIAVGGSSGKGLNHDISTDLVDPPQFVAGVIERGEDSNPLERSIEDVTIQQENYSYIQAIISPLAPAEAFSRAIATSRQLGWEIYAEVPNEGRIEAVDRTFWFDFKDDIVIRIKAENDGSRIDLRSVSRVGRGDLGANAKRIKLFTENFENQ